MLVAVRVPTTTFVGAVGAWVSAHADVVTVMSRERGPVPGGVVRVDADGVGATAASGR